MSSALELNERIQQVLKRIDSAMTAAGRDPSSLTIVLATKTRSSAEIRAGVELIKGANYQIAVAENRAQEISKYEQLSDLAVPRHFIGHIQSNKARDVVRFASLIHSIDRDSAIKAVAKWCLNDEVSKDILIQVNTSGEASKGGFEPDAKVLSEVIANCRQLQVLKPRGLMTIGANTTDQRQVLDSLKLLKQLQLELADPQITELSMGMSNDLELAIEAGATMIRLGSAVFGPRS